MSNNTKIPFLDLVTPHQELEQELLGVAKRAFETAGFIGGPMVEEFEREFENSAMRGFALASIAARMPCVSL